MINTLKQAEKFCAEHSLPFTAPRKQVLEIVLKAKNPVGAYDVLDKMPKGTNPPTVYRALSFWEKEGFLHRIASLNAYAPCHTDHDCDHGAQFLVCDGCRKIEEIHACDLPPAFAHAAKNHGFQAKGWSLEIHGLCSQCRAA